MAKKLLNQALQELIDYHPIYNSMYRKLVELNVKLDCKIDSMRLKPLGGLAGYSRGQFLFYNEKSITRLNIQEEIIHMIQSYEFYKDDKMDNNLKNVEFEAKLVQDLITILGDKLAGIRGMIGQNKEFEYKYQNMIKEFCVTNDVTPIIQRFHEFCQSWTGYAGKYNSDFVPEVIKKYFEE